MNPGADMHFAKDCPIATPVLNKAYGPMREDIIKSVPYVIVNAAMLIVSQKYLLLQKGCIASTAGLRRCLCGKSPKNDPTGGHRNERQYVCFM